MSFLELAAQRFSVRSFSDKPVEQEKIDAVSMALRWYSSYAVMNRKHGKARRNADIVPERWIAASFAPT